VQPPLISIILPVYNQSGHIGAVVQEYETALKNFEDNHETILVVNGCRDQSLSACRALADRYTSVKVLESRPGGWGLAVNLGLRKARGDLLCYTNSARTSAQDLVRFLRLARNHTNTVVKANRKMRDGWWRRFGSLLYNLECKMLFDLAYRDINGTPKIFPRTFDKLLTLQRNDDLLDIEFHVVCHRQQYPVLEIPIFSCRRNGGKSTTTIHSALKMYWGAYRLWRNQKTR
jgi:glycosyltransferase involved in cell wall biosynthesis